METFSDINTPLWDLSQANTFSQLPDDDFLALLQTQFPSNAPPYQYSAFENGVNPQNLSKFIPPSVTPPSEDSSPSPSASNSNNDSDDHETATKRKASSADVEEESGPNHKSQHTLANDKKGASASSRRKSGGGQDDSRRIKRMEQNRAAQRAFRERKEKHVKDLEDKVAELENKHNQVNAENENLRDLLSRLQSENMQLKQAKFTFTVPKDQASTSGGSSFAPTPSTSYASPSASTVSGNPLDWSSLQTFDPSVLSLLDDTPQSTATGGAMEMDFGFGAHGPFTTIASNPSFMSFASSFDDPPADDSSSAFNTDPGTFTFDNNSVSSWTGTSPASAEPGSMDELFCGPIDFHKLATSTPALTNNSLSPISHRSPSTSGSTSSSPNLSKNGDSSSRDSKDDGCNGQCPKTKSQYAQHIVSAGSSVFAPSPNLTVQETGETGSGPTIMCQGSSFPKTDQNDSNVPVLSAWRSITSEFKDADINQLCAEFTSKARCDGSKVVLEPQGVHHIMEKLSSRQKEKFQQQHQQRSDVLF